MSIIKNVSRRSMLKTIGIGAGLVLTAPLVAYSAKAEMMGKPQGLDGGVYLQVGLDGTVHITIHRVEMGQGSRTGLPMIIAEEIEADWERLEFHQSIGHEKYGDQNTDGSTSIRMFYTVFRKAGASARMMLEQAAASHWGVGVADVKAENHRIKNLKTGESEDFSTFVEAASSLTPPTDAEITLKDAKDFTILGKEKRIIDMDAILDGTAIYGQDVRRDGMVYSVIARPPVVGGVVKNYNDSAARKVAGVLEVVQMPDGKFPNGFNPLGGVAVIATNTWAAMKARDLLDITWDDGANASHASEPYEKALWDSVDKPDVVFRKRGDAIRSYNGAGIRLSADYFVPYQPHAAMEPLAATAEWVGDDLTVWTCVQDPQDTRNNIAAFMKVERPQVTVHPTLLGGAFGRKSKCDFAIEAAWLSKHTNQPVKVIWTREDDMRHDFYHAVSAQRIQAALESNGKVTSWHQTVAYPSIMGTFDAKVTGPSSFEMGLGVVDLPFNIPNLLMDAGAAKSETRIGWLRSVNNIQQAFAIGSFVDEIAHKTKTDPVDMWVKLIGKDRHFNPADDGAKHSNYGEKLETHPYDTGKLKTVLKKAADMAGWGRKLPAGHGLGISVHRSFASYVATVIEVSVIDEELKVLNGWTAIDCGQAVNTDRIKSQMEGAMIFGMTIALNGEVTMKDGATVEGNFDAYQLTRISEAPDVEVHIMDGNEAPGGVGEPGVPPVAAALMNAVFAASGKRIRQLPLKDQLSS